MHILVSNDDGIYADGLAGLYLALKDLGEISVVAPEREQSGTGHGITVHFPLRPRKVVLVDGSTGWAVDGTPADCVKLAVEALLTSPPDLVVSGINFGPNLGTDVLYSGTVSAAIEGLINGIPSIAVSLATYHNPDYTPAGNFIRQMVATLIKDGIPAGTMLNVNVPRGEPRGIKVTCLGNRRYVNIFHKRTDPRGREYYWMAGEPQDMTPHQENNLLETDVEAIRANHISITPLHFDLTDYKALGTLHSLPKKISPPKLP